MAALRQRLQMKPPLRPVADRAALVEASVRRRGHRHPPPDHAPHPGSEKCRNSSAARSASSVSKTALGLALDRLVHFGQDHVGSPGELFTVGPESILRLGAARSGPGAGRRHHLSTEMSWTYDVNLSFSRSRNSPSTENISRGPVPPSSAARSPGARVGPRRTLHWRGMLAICFPEPVPLASLPCAMAAMLMIAYGMKTVPLEYRRRESDPRAKLTSSRPSRTCTKPSHQRAGR